MHCNFIVSYADALNDSCCILPQCAVELLRIIYFMAVLIGFPRLLEIPGISFKFSGPGKFRIMILVLESAGNLS